MTKKKVIPKLLNAETIPVTDIKWIWYPYIPANCATLLFGVGGVGKSYMSVEIAAALSSGRSLPGQTSVECKEHKVLLLSAEDHPSAVIKPRLVKCGAKLENIFIPAEPFILDEWGLDVIKTYMEACKATIVIIDPIVHYMGGKIDMNKMNEVRALTGALHQNAMTTDYSIIIVHHARKGTEGASYEKAAGSADFVNSVRSVIFANIADDGTSVLAHVKTNYAIYGKPLAYFIDEDGFHWVGYWDENTGKKKATATKRDEAIDFLNEALRNGPIPAKELLSLAKAEGINTTTINRAKRTCAESIMRYVDEDRFWFWRLKGDATEPKGCTHSPEQNTEKKAEAFLRAHGRW